MLQDIESDKIRLKFTQVKDLIYKIKNFPVKIDQRNIDTKKLMIIIAEYNKLNNYVKNENLRINL